MYNEYNLKVVFKNIEDILLKKESERGANYVMSFSGDSASLTSTELSCLIATVNNELYWLIANDDNIKEYDTSSLVSNSYNLTITKNGEVIFKERATTDDDGTPYIQVVQYLNATKEEIARDLLHDIIPTKGLSPKSRLWN